MLTRTLYERLGGEAAVKATVARMYEKILDDDVLKPFFSTINVDDLRHSQHAFVTYAFGGPNIYTGRSLREVHRPSVNNGLTEMHFDRVLAHLGAAMRELNVPDALIAEAAAIVETTRKDVLNKV